MRRCSRVVVKGQVQGVFYRDFVQKKAKDWSIEGTVQNAQDGSIVINACGKTENFDDFVDALYQGPPKSMVEEVVEQPLLSPSNFRGVFRIIGVH